MMFRDRTEAGKKLGLALAGYAKDRPLVVGLPRGGVIVAGQVVASLPGSVLDVLLVKKLRAPGNPELAIGAIGESGCRYLDDEVCLVTGVSRHYIEEETKVRLNEMEIQRNRYRSIQQRQSPKDKMVIVVDDGLATGSTMMAAVKTLAIEQPSSIVVAVPVSSVEAADMIRRLPVVSDLVCLAIPDYFGGVGMYYDDFEQTTDDDVCNLLKAKGKLTGFWLLDVFGGLEGGEA